MIDMYILEEILNMLNVDIEEYESECGYFSY